VVLPVDEEVHVLGDGGKGLLEGDAVGAKVGVAVFDALQDAGDADLDELVEIAGGDGEELDPLEEGIGFVLGLFEDAAVKAEPGFIPAKEEILLGILCVRHIKAGALNPHVYKLLYTMHKRQ
jgi:hypothetical protein